MTGASDRRRGPAARAELFRACVACLVLSGQPASASDERLPPPASPARPDHLTGAVYGLGPGRSVLFRWEMERDDARGVWRSRYYDPAGNLNTEDEVIFSVGALVRYGYVRHGVGETSSVERRGARLVYSRVLDGRQDESEEEYSEDFAVGPTVVLQAQRHWTALMAGKGIRIRYGVLDRLRSFRFDLARDPEHKGNGPDSVVVRMRPASAFVRLFVEPVYLVFSEDGRDLRRIIGRTLPMERERGRLRAVDGDLVIERTEGANP